MKIVMIFWQIGREFDFQIGSLISAFYPESTYQLNEN
jgi:hypothetical protein